MRRSALLLAVVLAAGCAVSTPRTALQAWAQSVNGLRDSADVHISRRNLPAAEADLRRIFSLSPPSEDAGVAQLLQDAHFALGSVMLLQGRFVDAIAEADAGLKLTGEQSIFGANLHALRAMALEGQGKPLDALEDYQRALRIHAELFDAALAAHDGGEG